MKALGTVLAVIGIIAMGAGLFMDEAAPGSRISNLSLMNMKLVLTIVGSALFVGGAVFHGTGQIMERLGVAAIPPSISSGASPGEMPEMSGASKAGTSTAAGSEAWRKSFGIVRSVRARGHRVYFLTNDTVALDGRDETFPDMNSALKAVS